MSCALPCILCHVFISAKCCKPNFTILALNECWIEILSSDFVHHLFDLIVDDLS